MGKKRTKGIVVEIGGSTTGLNKALESTNKNISQTQAELKDVERLLKLDPKNTELLAQKQKLLAQATGETNKKLDALKQANEQVAKTAKNYDAWKAAYDPIQEEITNTSTKLKDLRNRQQELSDCGEIDTQEYKDLQKEAEEASRTLRDLRKKAKDVSEEFGNPISTQQYDSLQREIIATQQELGDLSQKADKTEKAIKGIDEKPIREVERASDDAGNALRDMGKDALDLGDLLTAGGIIEGVKGIAGAVADLNEETMEHRKVMGTLETSSEAAGYSAEQTAASYSQLFGVLGDDQASATTLANLQAMGLSQTNLTRIIDGTVGAWAKYGDSIPIDSLAESVNETVKAQQVTGTFADVLNWGAKEGETFGVTLKQNIEFTKLTEKQLKGLSAEERQAYESRKKLYEETEAYNKEVLDAASAEDFFNIALKNCKNDTERANLVLNAMSKQGLQKMAEAWREDNAAIVEANDAQNEFADKTAELSEKLQPAVQAVKDGGNDLLQMALDLTEQVDMDKVVEMIDQVFTGIESLITFCVDHHELVLGILISLGAGLAALKLISFVGMLAQAQAGIVSLATTFPMLGTAITAMGGPIFWIIAAIIGLVVTIGTKGDEIQAYLGKLDAWLQNIFAKDWTEVFGPVLGGALNLFCEKAKEQWDAFKRILDGIIDFIRGVFTQDWDRMWRGVRDILGGIFDSMVGLVKAPLNGIISMVNAMIFQVVSGVNQVLALIGKIPGVTTVQFSIPQLPMLADGGVFSSGSAIVGDAGPELLTVGPNGAMVQPLPANTGRIEGLLSEISGKFPAGSGGSTKIVVQAVLDGEVIGETAYDYIQDRRRADG